MRLFINCHSEQSRVPVQNDTTTRISFEHFNTLFHCGFVTLPQNVILVGWSSSAKKWYWASDTLVHNWSLGARLPALLFFLRSYVIPRLGKQEHPFWMMFCYYDGWRERLIFSEKYRWIEGKSLELLEEWQGEPGEIPIMGKRRWLTCFGAHRGDPSALLLPEAHYLDRHYYHPLFHYIDGQQISWSDKQNRAIYCGGNHGERANYFPPIPGERPHPRQYLQQLAGNLPVDVHLGQNIPIKRQIGHKYILDVDGYTRTWDAWAWKMRSGSVVLSVDSPWESFFTAFFKPWKHYIPVANDFSDLGEKITWCLSHDRQCQRIVQRAFLRTKDVYNVDHVAHRVVLSFKKAFTAG